MDTVKIGIIGYGWMGSTHAKVLKTLREAELVAVADPLREARVKAQNDNPSIKTYSDPRELLDDNSVDAVIIASPPDTHVPLLVKAVEKHKHVLVEKPLGPDLESLKPLLDMNPDPDLVIMTAFSLRYHSMYTDLEKMISDLGRTILFQHVALGDIPPPKWVLDPRISGGLLNENAIHILYLITWYFGFPEKIYAVIRDHVKPGLNDNITLTTIHPGNTVSIITRSWTAGQVVRYYEIIGEKGSIHLDGYLGGIVRLVKKGEKIEKNYEFELEEMYKRELGDFIESIKKNRKPMVGLREGILMQILVHAAKVSSRENTVVEPMKAGGELAVKLLEKYPG